MVTMKKDHNTSVGKDVEEHSFIAAGNWHNHSSKPFGNTY